MDQRAAEEGFRGPFAYPARGHEGLRPLRKGTEMRVWAGIIRPEKRPGKRVYPARIPGVRGLKLLRLAKNRGYSEEKSRAIMESQAGEAEFEAFCDRRIDNNGTLEETRRQIDGLLTERKAEEPTI